MADILDFDLTDNPPQFMLVRRESVPLEGEDRERPTRLTQRPNLYHAMISKTVYGKRQVGGYRLIWGTVLAEIS